MIMEMSVIDAVLYRQRVVFLPAPPIRDFFNTLHILSFISIISTILLLVYIIVIIVVCDVDAGTLATRRQQRFRQTCFQSQLRVTSPLPTSVATV